MPAFAERLGTRDLESVFPDLWAVDLALWERIGAQADPDALAIAWLESPGRRLVQDISLLRRLHDPARPTRLGAADLSLERIYAAAGVADAPADSSAYDAFFAAHPVPWRELHTAVPGRAIDGWQPREREDERPILRAIDLLEHGSPPGLRGAALAWLLGRAVEAPIFEVNGIRRDLRDDLPIRIATSLATWFADDGRAVISRELEALTLQHAACITATDTRPGAAFRTWGVARWLGRCLRRSPWFGEDEEILVAHLRALLPAPAVIAEGTDPLHPARFNFATDALDPAEMAFLAGVLSHYAGDERPMLLPTPLPIVHALRRIAERPILEAEERAERTHATHASELGWPAPHVAPPLAARWLMTRRRIGWIREMPEKAQQAQLDTIERLAREPARYAWVTEALFHEGDALTPSASHRAIEVFRTFFQGATSAPLPERQLATMAAGLLRGLEDDEIRRVADLAMVDEPGWKPFVLDALAMAAERNERHAILVHVLERLLDLVENTASDDRDRLNAALFALRRLSSMRLPERAAMLERLARAAVNPPFSAHLGLRRELRRLGLGGPIANAGGGSR
jgi:hypothetical protein